MNFLQLGMLLALPLAAVPVIIHLIHQQRHRTVKWAAMMFLLDAKRMNHGIDQLRQILILAMRVLALLFLIFAVSRPLVSGWLGLAMGGVPDTTLILLDRSASMEETDVTSGLSKRETAVRRVADALEKGVRSERIVLIDSALLQPVEIRHPGDLKNLPQTGPTATRANIPGLVQAAMDYAVAQKLGNAEIWLCSDLREGDWQPDNGAWESLRASARELPNLRWRLLTFPEGSPDNLGVQVEAVRRRELPGNAGAELLLDLEVRRQGQGPVGIPFGLVVNGVRTVSEIAVEGDRQKIRGLAVPVGRDRSEGWGMVELPADRNAMDDRAYFVFAPETARRSVIVAENENIAAPLLAALRARVEPGAVYEADFVLSSKVAEVDWDVAMLVVWQAPLPAADSLEAKHLIQFVQSGRSVLFFPPTGADANRLFGIGWEEWKAAAQEERQVGWWRTDADILANTGDGKALPFGELKVKRFRGVAGDGLILARSSDGAALVMRGDVSRGAAFFCGLSPDPAATSLASDGVAFFVLLHRLLQKGVNAGARSQQWEAGLDALADGTWERLGATEEALGPERGLRAGAYRSGERFRALNRPIEEGNPERLDSAELAALLAGFDYRVIEGRAGEGGALANEIWRSLVILMGLVLLAEAVLCMPPAPDPAKRRFESPA
ncbi:MAG: Aerotolerance regulator N-terminal [Verrucomicrobia bacterium]|nr:MAG: Aerotolerance regulator N-terminal [Verrucomicrobiota bacterium]